MSRKNGSEFGLKSPGSPYHGNERTFRQESLDFQLVTQEIVYRLNYLAQT